MQVFNNFLTQDFIAKAISNPLENETCAQLHSGSCNVKALEQFRQGCKSMYKMYLLVHLIPLLTVKRKKVRQDPIGQLKKLLVGFVKSLLFAGGYSALVRRYICFGTAISGYSGGLGLPAAIVASVSLVLEPVSRQSQIALYTLNKSMEVVYNMALRRNMVKKVPLGECWLTSIAFAIICFTYINDPQIWRINYKRVLDKLIGDV